MAVTEEVKHALREETWASLRHLAPDGQSSGKTTNPYGWHGGFIPA